MEIERPTVKLTKLLQFSHAVSCLDADEQDRHQRLFPGLELLFDIWCQDGLALAAMPIPPGTDPHFLLFTMDDIESIRQLSDYVNSDLIQKYWQFTNGNSRGSPHSSPSRKHAFLQDETKHLMETLDHFPDVPVIGRSWRNW